MKVITKANSLRSKLYKVGIVYNNNKTIFINKSIWSRIIINDVVKLRFYIFGKDETYDKVKSELVEDKTELS